MEKYVYNNHEIIANLWYILDEDGFIYSLRAKLYVLGGNDDEKLKFLKECATNDYLVAQPFPIPNSYSTKFATSQGEQKIPVLHIASINAVGGPQILFEEAFNKMENELPIQTKLSIPQNPCIVITPLLADDNGNIYPKITKRQIL